ncbi:MAG: hypothetical protein EOP04_25665 [Proteobacteria bacterium]|nr:MAG: hypothetical protein EOP04_25665 [Pseudomonadota bacterium]
MDLRNSAKNFVCHGNKKKLGVSLAMSTASRPTYAPAVGRQSTTNIRTVYASAKDQASHTTLKLRQVGQATTEEIKKRDYRAELELKTQKYVLEKDKTTAWMAKEVEKTPVLMLKDVEINNEEIRQIQQQFNDEDVVLNPAQGSDDDSFGSDSDSDGDDDDEDDEEELKAELERIRKERAEAAARREEEERVRQEKEKRDEAVRSDPLIHLAGESAKVSPPTPHPLIILNSDHD